MDKISFFDILIGLLSNANFVLAMIIIVFVAICFLGRNIKITRGMIISSLFLFIITGIVSVVLFFVEDDLLEFFTRLLESPEDGELFTGYVEVEIINAFAFVFAFVFYLFAYKEKRLIRALEATICLYGYYYFIQTTIYNSAIYLSGTSDEMLNMISNVVSDNNTLMKAVVLIDLVIDVIILAILYFVFYKPRKIFVIKPLYRVIFVIWIFISSLIMYIPIYSTEITDRYRLLSTIVGILIPSLSIFAPVVIVLIATERSLKEKNEYQENYLKAELEYIEQYKRSQTETRAFRHDIINNLSLAKMMLDEGRVSEADEHISELLGNIKSLSPKYVTGDEKLDLIVSMKAGKMQEKEIEFKCDGVVDGGLDMKPMEICGIFANALDNAIEAASDTKNPFVDMNIKRTDKFFVIKIANSCIGIVDTDKLFMSSGFTSKTDKEHHGFGLRNIRDSVERHNGIVKAESEEGLFALTIMLPR